MNVWEWIFKAHYILIFNLTTNYIFVPTDCNNLGFQI